VIVLNLSGQLPLKTTLTLTLGGGLVGLVGGLDDRWRLPVYLRLSAHCAAAGLAIGLIGSMQSVSIGQTMVYLGYAAWPVTFVSIVWFLNLFNFMDGIDGLAISEAVFISGAGGILAAQNGAPAGTVMALFVLAAACAGFIPINWPPARMFMGDAGSGFLGFMVAVLALATIASGSLTVWTWMLLSGTFLTDATVTLLRRLARGESIHHAHRSHAYQRLARKWKRHGPVTTFYMALNLAWLFPLAWLSARWSHAASIIAVTGILPLVVAAIISGAGNQPGHEQSC
jgi:Fuc2NAc and GlcNAc transferase